MLFRFTLIHDILGAKVINEPDGWKDCKLKLERDKNFKSLIEYFDGSFIFYGASNGVDGGIDFIKECEQTYGFDTLIRITIELSVDGYTYEDLFEGQLNLAGSVEMPDNKIQIPIIRDDFWSKFINRLDTPVNVQSILSLDNEAVDQFDSVNLRLSSQILDLKHYSIEKRGVYVLMDQSYVQYQPDEVELDEIKENYSLPISSNPELPTYIFSFEYAGLLDIDIRIEYDKAVFSVPTGHKNARTIYDWYIQKNNETPIEFNYSNAHYDDASVYTNWGIFTPANDDVDTTIATYFDTISIRKDDVIRIYLNRDSVANNQIAIWGADGLHIDSGSGAEDVYFYSNKPLGMIDTPTYFRFNQHSVFPATNAFGVLIHDLAGQICDRITSKNDSFHSECLGSDQTIYKQYPSNGCDWMYAAFKGLQIRQYSLLEKPFFLSFNQWWKGVNPVLCLGLSYETVDGNQVIRIERMSEYYDSSSVSLAIDNVRQITREYDQNAIFKTLKVGYSQWQSEDVSGIDDPQTTHTYATRFSKSGTDLDIQSDFIAASLAIETTRRTTKVKSADYKFDNNTFIIAINPNIVDADPPTTPDVDDYLPELDENFTSITNLLNSETRYNSRITPARNLERWLRYISGCLQSYPTAKFKFVSGEGNYDMTSDLINVSDGCDEYNPNLSEKQDIDISNNPLHLCFLYKITIPMGWADYKIVRENRKKAISISQTTTNHVKFFIETLEYELVKGIATISAWPVEYLDIQTLENDSFMRTCEPLAPCEGGYLTQDNSEFITENGNCLILN